MKKMIVLTMSIFLIVSVAAQQWVNFPRPEGLKSVNQIVFKGDTIAIFDSAVTYVTTDFGTSWLASVSPFSFLPNVSRFGEGYYATSENKIFFSHDLVSWEVSAVLDVESVSSLSAGNAIIATAMNAGTGDFVLLRSVDGVHFTEGHSAVSFSSPVFMGDTIIVMLRSGLPKSPRYRSIDNGLSWSILDTAMITDFACDYFDHKYEVVGASGIDTVAGVANFQSSGIGEYAFNGFFGSLMTSVTFSSFGCLMVGSQYDDQGNAIRSFCVKNGETDSATFFESKSLSVFSNHGSLVILSGDYGKEMWIAKRSAYPGGVEERQKYFSVFPNPTTGDVTVVSPSKMEAVLYNENFKILDRHILVSGNNHFNLSTLPSGVYFLKSPNGFVSKILKQ